MAKCRFQDLEICRVGIQMTDGLFDLADDLGEEKLHPDYKLPKKHKLIILSLCALGSVNL